jgi:hypothetical protein
MQTNLEILHAKDWLPVEYKLLQIHITAHYAHLAQLIILLADWHAARLNSAKDDATSIEHGLRAQAYYIRSQAAINAAETIRTTEQRPEQRAT